LMFEHKTRNNMRILHEIRKLSLKILGLAAGLLIIKLLVFPNTLDIIILLLICAVLVCYTYD
jgi:hypothetical protein